VELWLSDFRRGTRLDVRKIGWTISAFGKLAAGSELVARELQVEDLRSSYPEIIVFWGNLLVGKVGARRAVEKRVLFAAFIAVEI
jgi:hypothetical protein